MPSSSKKSWAYPEVILVATDVDDLDRLMPHAFQQAAETGARLILLNVLGTSAAMATDIAGRPYYDPAGSFEHVEKALMPWCEEAIRRGISCDGLVREGSATQQIVAAGRQFHAGRVLLGTRSRSKLGKLLIGSVAEQVLRSVYLPVMTVGPEAHLPVDSDSAQRVVLHATTLREASHPSAALACQIAASQKAKLVLLHILPTADEMQKQGQSTRMDSAAHDELATLGDRIGACCCSAVETVVIHGNPSIEILAEASARKASLIVLGATRRSIFENLTRDRTIYKVLAHSRCPVLTLRVPLPEMDECRPQPTAAMQE